MDRLIHNLFYISCIDIIDDIKHVMKNNLFMCSVGKILPPVGLEVGKSYTDETGLIFRHSYTIESFNEEHPYNNGYKMLFGEPYIKIVYYITSNQSYISCDLVDVKNMCALPFESAPIWKNHVGFDYSCIKEHEPIFYFI